MREFISYLDGVTLINLYFCGILDYHALSTFIQRHCFRDEATASRNADAIEVAPSEREQYFCGDLAALKSKCCLQCDIELRARDGSNWNEEWTRSLSLDRYQQYSAF